jgi:hypothetical protein
MIYSLFFFVACTSSSRFEIFDELASAGSLGGRNGSMMMMMMMSFDPWSIEN